MNLVLCLPILQGLKSNIASFYNMLWHHNFNFYTIFPCCSMAFHPNIYICFLPFHHLIFFISPQFLMPFHSTTSASLYLKLHIRENIYWLISINQNTRNCLRKFKQYIYQRSGYSIFYAGFVSTRTINKGIPGI